MFTDEQLKAFSASQIALMLNGTQILQVIEAIVESPTRVGSRVLPIFSEKVVEFLAKWKETDKKEENKEEKKEEKEKKD